MLAVEQASAGGGSSLLFFLFVAIEGKGKEKTKGGREGCFFLSFDLSRSVAVGCGIIGAALAGAHNSGKPRKKS